MYSREFVVGYLNKHSANRCFSEHNGQSVQFL